MTQEMTLIIEIQHVLCESIIVPTMRCIGVMVTAREHNINIIKMVTCQISVVWTEWMGHVVHTDYYMILIRNAY